MYTPKTIDFESNGRPVQIYTCIVVVGARIGLGLGESYIKTVFACSPGILGFIFILDVEQIQFINFFLLTNRKIAKAENIKTVRCSFYIVCSMFIVQTRSINPY